MTERPESLDEPSLDALTRDRDAVRVDLPEPMLETMLAEARRRTVDRRPTLRDRLRELPSRARLLLVVLAFAVPGVGALRRGLRHDVAELLRPDRLGWGLVLVVVLGFAVGLVVRGVHRRSAGRLEPVIAAAALGLPILLAAIPGLWPGAPVPEGAALGAHRACFAMSGLVAGPTAAVALAVLREDRPSVSRVLLAAGAGGAAAFLAQMLHCPWSDPVHLLVAHASVGLAVAAVGVAGRSFLEG